MERVNKCAFDLRKHTAIPCSGAEQWLENKYDDYQSAVRDEFVRRDTLLAGAHVYGQHEYAQLEEARANFKNMYDATRLQSL